MCVDTFMSNPTAMNCGQRREAAADGYAVDMDKVFFCAVVVNGINSRFYLDKDCNENSRTAMAGGFATMNVALYNFSDKS